ncbi:unnamed protein product [Fraxinus pennsylvanica]|uniref:MoaB/Mog domain-containing protein n=1 Tax=Fraxinus pennsylvanica TaxID=56036 RepID=A0AAD2A0S7_9LAMI|nr:unnamed protein product [Fraxinus pennsylvanica]
MHIALKKGTFNDLDHHQVAALASCFIPGDKTGDQIELKAELAKPLQQLQDSARRIAELRFGNVEDRLGLTLCRKLHSIGWAISQFAVTQNNVDSVAEEVERQKSRNDMVFIYGGVGPLHSDVTVAGVAKVFGDRTAKWCLTMFCNPCKEHQ